MSFFVQAGQYFSSAMESQFEHIYVSPENIWLFNHLRKLHQKKTNGIL